MCLTLQLAHARMQYDMHASSFQRDITTSQQGAKTNGAPEYCTRGKYFSTIILRLLLL